VVVRRQPQEEEIVKIRISSEVEIAPEDVASLTEELRTGRWNGSGALYTQYLYAVHNKIDSHDYTAEVVDSLYIAGVAQPRVNEAPREFDVTLISISENQGLVRTVKALREIVWGLGLREAKDLVDGAPSHVLSRVDREQADGAAAGLRAVGAEVEITLSIDSG
jgi:large subunit ribosomal protein L7/L12